MRRDHRDNAACAKDESFATCLLEGVRRLCPHLCLIPIHQSILPYAATDRACKYLLCLSQ